MKSLKIKQTLVAAWGLLCCAQVFAAEWSNTELDYKYGTVDAPAFAGGAAANTHILTLQHASGWNWGDVFFFVDSLHDNRRDGFNDNDLYGEIYVNFSASKLTGSAVSFGPIKDVGALIGLNAGQNAKVQKYLPGVRLSWDAPGFAFLNSDFTLYLDDSAGVARGGAPRESSSQMIDINWSRPFEVGSQSFSFEGHTEYIFSRRDEFGAQVSSWLLAQPEIRWNVGRALGVKPQQFQVGVALQYWRNKLGDSRTNESRAQLLLAWHF